MSGKKIQDLSLAELEQILIQNESSLDKLVEKAMLLLRAAIVSLGRVTVLMGASEKPPPKFFEAIYRLTCLVAYVARNLEELVSRNKKAPARAGAQTNPSHRG